jgi:hypothetical protein
MAQEEGVVFFLPTLRSGCSIVLFKMANEQE